MNKNDNLDNQNPTTKKYLTVYLIIFGALLLCFRAFQNHYPLLYSDTGTYIRSGFLGTVPLDRPIIYGLFLRHISLSVTPWLVIFTQGLLISILMYLCLKHFTLRQNPYRLFIIVLVGLIAGTGISINVSQLIPDIFAPICWMCLALLLLGHSLQRKTLIFISIVFLLGDMTHNSHLIINLLTILSFAFYVYWNQSNFKEKLKILKSRIILCLGLSIGAWFLLPSIHAIYGYGFQTSKSSQFFIVSKFAQTGILDKYLSEYCGEKTYKLCEYQGKFTNNFLWAGAGSPFYLTGGWEAKEEYKQLVNDIFSTPKYVKMFAIKSLQFSIKQFFSFETGDTRPQNKKSACYHAIKTYFPDELQEYEIALQQYNMLDWKLLNYTQSWIILFSTAILFLLLLSPNLYFSNQYYQLVVLLFLFLFLNALVCGTLSDTVPRYQSRLIWLIPFVTIVGLSIAYPQWNQNRVKKKIL